jgi:NADP-dependent 3-hydroxy acid dehydrogenase YdfG
VSARRGGRPGSRTPARTALVTDGGSGIGSAIARRFAADGARVRVIGSRVEPLPQIALETGGEYATCDISDHAQLDGFVARLGAAWARFDVIANAAGASSVQPFAAVCRRVDGRGMHSGGR